MERVEIIARTERRQRWTEREKSELRAEAAEPGSSIGKVARKHGAGCRCPDCGAGMAMLGHDVTEVLD